MNIDPKHPAMKWKNKMDMYETRSKASEHDIALASLFKFYGKSFDSDLEQRALYANKIKDLGFSHRDISIAIDEIVTRMDKLPTLSEFLQFLPRRDDGKQVFYASQSKALEDELKTVDALKGQFIELLCEGDETKYKDLMSRMIKAWFIKAYEYTEVEFQGLKNVTSLMVYERCVLIDWRDSGFSKSIFDISKQKRDRLKEKSRVNRVDSVKTQENRPPQKPHPIDVPF